VRTDGKETLAVIHAFGGEIPEKVMLPVKADQILRVMCSEENRVTLAEGKLTVELKAPFEAVAVHLTRVES
jgi:alpha-galactosidase